MKDNIIKWIPVKYDGKLGYYKIDNSTNCMWTLRDIKTFRTKKEASTFLTKYKLSGGRVYVSAIGSNFQKTWGLINISPEQQFCIGSSSEIS